MTPPWVVVLTGAPGSGKSSTAQELARRTGAAVLDQDSMTNPLMDVVARLVGAETYDDPRLAALTRRARYDCLLRVAADCVAAGVPVVLVAPFTTERRDPGAWQALAEQISASGGAARLFWLRIAPQVLTARLAARAAARDAAKLRDLTAYVAGLDLAAPAAPHVALDAALPPSAQVEQLLRALG